jgi:hypothetical protein
MKGGSVSGNTAASNGGGVASALSKIKLTCPGVIDETAVSTATTKQRLLHYLTYKIMLMKPKPLGLARKDLVKAICASSKTASLVAPGNARRQAGRGIRGMFTGRRRCLAAG